MALSEPRTTIIQTPIEVVARSMLACDNAVLSVMILGREGKLLAYEDVETSDATVTSEKEECQLAFYSQTFGILVSIRLDRPVVNSEIEVGIRRILDSAYSVMTP